MSDLRLWWQVRQEISPESIEPLQDAGELTVLSWPTFAVRLCIQNTGKRGWRRKGDLSLGINVLVPIACGLEALDRRVTIVGLPSADADLYPGEVSAVRFSAARVEIDPGDFGMVDVAVTAEKSLEEVPILAKFSIRGTDESGMTRLLVRRA